MNKIMLLVVSVIFGLLSVFMTVPANATTCDPTGTFCDGGDLYHDPDGGYDAPIIVFCNWGEAFKMVNGEVTVQLQWDKDRLVHEGTSSKSDCGIDTDVVYVRADEEVWCDFPTGPTYDHRYLKIFDAKGPHKIEDNWSEDCVLKRD